MITPWIKAELNYTASFFATERHAHRSTHFPEAVHFAIHERLVLPLDFTDVVDVAGVQVLLDHKAQEAVVWSMSWGGEDGTWQLNFDQREQTPTITNFNQAVASIIKCFHVTLFFLYLQGGSRGRSVPTQPQLHLQ